MNAVVGVGDATNKLRAKNIRINNGAEINAIAGVGNAVNDLGAKNINVSNAKVNAEAGLGTATNNLHAKNITIKNAKVNASVLAGAAENNLIASNDIKIQNSTIKSKVYGIGAAIVNMFAGHNIDIDPSTIESKVNGSGIASVNLNAGNNLSITDSLVKAKVGQDGVANVKLEADHNVKINNSNIKAKVNGDGLARIKIEAGNDVKIKNNSVIKAKVSGTGLATVTTVAGDDVKLSKNSKITAVANKGVALATLVAGDSINARGRILAKSNNGYAAASLLAGGDIYAGNVKAVGTRDAISDLESLLNSLTGDVVDIGAQYPYGSGILLGSLNGDITLGDISADAVLVSALGGSIYDEGDVNAHYLGLLARYNIGTELNPLMTNVDILSAYSWDKGNIYVKEANDIELGLYLPISVNGSQWGALGASVAANDGIIHITSGDDMVVNSVISPRGGVFLESTNGSIYAGRGWCPVISQAELDSVFGSGSSFIKNFAQNALMGMGGTEWSTVAGVDYFSPIMFAIQPLTGTSDLPLGPNVIAGGYSYLSAPKGTIGVGAKNNPAVGLFDNPLKVNVQVLTENLAGNNSALPGGGISPAGLTIKVGGGTGLYDNGINGPLPVSAFIEGLVRPGTTSINGDNPSPELDLSIVPPGYIFYNDTDSAYGKDCPGCSVPLYGPPATNKGPLQIWPEIPFDLSGIFGQLSIDPRIRNIYNPNFRTVFIDRQTPTGTYFYHPLTPSDSTAFDGIALSAGAYDFIDGVLGLKGDNNFSPFYQDDNGKKKNKGKG